MDECWQEIEDANEGQGTGAKGRANEKAKYPRTCFKVHEAHYRHNLL